MQIISKHQLFQEIPLFNNNKLRISQNFIRKTEIIKFQQYTPQINPTLKNNKMAHTIKKKSDKDITSYIKEWMFKQFKDENFQQIAKDYEQGLLKKYEDPYFPPNNESLGQKIVKKFKDLIWRRAPEFIEKVQVLDLNVEQKVNQGRIGDCYLLNPIGLLGIIQKSMISRLFTIKEPNQFGYYSVWLFIDGKWQYITVDETFPWWITRKKPYFCDVVNNTQIWAMIIEKAWAKLHGEYSRLWGGDTGLAFRVITGAPTKSYGLKKYRKDPRKKDYVYKQIEYHLSQGHLISVTTGALDDYGKSIMTQGHSYALIGYKKEENKYIIRDPRGETNVFGRECVIVCLLHPDYVFTQHELQFEDEQLKSERIFKIKVDKRMKFHISFFQPNKRFFKPSEKSKRHKLSKITVKVLKIDSKEGQITKAKTISSRSGKNQQLDLEVNLSKGSYYIYCLIEWNSDEHRKINICSYGQHFVEFIDLSSDKKLNQLKEFLEVQRIKKEEQKQNKKNQKQKNQQINKTQVNITPENDQQDNIQSNILKSNNTQEKEKKEQLEQKQTEILNSESIQIQNNQSIQIKELDNENNIKNEQQSINKIVEQYQSQNENINNPKDTSDKQKQKATNLVTTPLFIAKRNQFKSKTLVSQKRNSLNKSSNRIQIPKQPTDLIKNVKEEPKSQQQTRDFLSANSNQQLDNVESSNSHRLKKQKQQFILKERRSIRGPQQVFPLEKQDSTQSQIVELQNYNPLIKVNEQQEYNAKVGFRYLKDLSNLKILPPICTSPQTKNHIINTYSNQKTQSLTEQKVPKHQSYQQQIENKSIIATTINSVILYNNITEQPQQQLQNSQKIKNYIQTPQIKQNNGMLSNISLLNQLNELKIGTSSQFQEKQNQGLIPFSQKNKKPTTNQIRVHSLQKVFA